MCFGIFRRAIGRRPVPLRSSALAVDGVCLAEKFLQRRLDLVVERVVQASLQTSAGAVTVEATGQALPVSPPKEPPPKRGRRPRPNSISYGGIQESAKSSKASVSSQTARQHQQQQQQQQLQPQLPPGPPPQRQFHSQQHQSLLPTLPQISAAAGSRRLDASEAAPHGGGVRLPPAGRHPPTSSSPSPGKPQIDPYHLYMDSVAVTSYGWRNRSRGARRRAKSSLGRHESGDKLQKVLPKLADQDEIDSWRRRVVESAMLFARTCDVPYGSLQRCGAISLA